MEYRLCDKCLETYGLRKNENTPFPSFTVLGGIFGVISSLYMGPLVVPAGLLVGAGTDVVRCQRCGSEANIYESIKEKQNRRGQKSYVRVPFKLYEDVVPLDDQFTLEENQQEFVYDDIEGRFVSTQEQNPSEMDVQEIDSTFDDCSPFEASDMSVDEGSIDGGVMEFGLGDSSSGFGEGGEGGGDAGGSNGGGI